MKAITVAYPTELDAAGWESRHAQGMVPGRWPYGLDRLCEDGIELTRLEFPARSRQGRVAAYAAEAIPWLRPDPSASRALLTWDEGVALRATGHRRDQAHYSGIIWMTDSRNQARLARLKQVLLKCAGLWVLSQAQIEPLKELLGPNHPRIHFIRFGIDAEFYTPSPYPDRPLVLSAGSDRDRDPDLLFAALDLVHRAQPEAEIIVQSRSDLPAPPGITVIPTLSHTELRALYRRMTVMAIATRPNLHVSGMTVALEAFATARPVVMTGSPGLGDYATQETGALIVPREPASMAEGIIALLKDPRGAQELGAAGSSHVFAHHTHVTMADQLRSITTADG